MERPCSDSSPAPIRSRSLPSPGARAWDVFGGTGVASFALSFDTNTERYEGNGHHRRCELPELTGERLSRRAAREGAASRSQFFRGRKTGELRSGDEQGRPHGGAGSARRRRNALPWSRNAAATLTMQRSQPNAIAPPLPVARTAVGADYSQRSAHHAGRPYRSSYDDLLKGSVRSNVIYTVARTSARSRRRGWSRCRASRRADGKDISSTRLTIDPNGTRPGCSRPTRRSTASGRGVLPHPQGGRHQARDQEVAYPGCATRSEGRPLRSLMVAGEPGGLWSAIAVDNPRSSPHDSDFSGWKCDAKEEAMRRRVRRRLTREILLSKPVAASAIPSGKGDKYGAGTWRALPAAGPRLA